MTDETEDQTVEVPQMSQEDMQRLHDLVMSIEVQFENIGRHHPNLMGPAMLSVATFMVEKIYHCSNGMEAAQALLASAQEVGLQNWIDEVERAAANEPQIIKPN